MNNFLEFGLRQTATFWQKTGSDGFNNPTFATPVEVICRWEERSEFVQDEKGEEVRAGASVYLKVTVSVGDYIALGSYTETDPRDIDNVWRVLDFKEIPGIYNEMSQKVAYLRRAYF